MERVELKSDGEPALKALKDRVKKKREKPTDLAEGSLKDSASMGAIEATIRWWQAKTRTLRFDLEARYARMMNADHILWPWLVRHASFVMEKYRVRADGSTSHFAAFGCGYKGEILPFGETALFKVPMSHTRQVSAKTTAHKGRVHVREGHLGR